MRGFFGVLIGVIVFAIGLSGLAVALGEMMTQADPHASLKAAAGLGTFVLAALASVAIIR